MKLLVLLSLVPAIHAIPFAHGCSTPAQRARAPAAFCDATLSHDARVAALVGAMTIPEKVNLTWISGCTSEDPTDGGVGYVGEERESKGRRGRHVHTRVLRDTRDRDRATRDRATRDRATMYPSTRREAHGNTRERDAEAHTQRDKTQADHLHTSNRVRPPLHPSSNSHTHTHHLPQPPRRPRLRVGRGDPPWGAEHVPERQLPYDLPRPGQPRLLLQRVGLSRGRLCHLHRDAVSAALNESIIVSYRCSQCTSMYCVMCCVV